MKLETRVLLRSEQTGGMTAVVENTLPPNFEGPPLHLHDFDEAFYVLDGEITFLLNGETQIGRPGELVFAPRCVPHTLANQSDSPARYLLICSPAGFERYFDAIAADNQGVVPPPEAAKPYPQTVMLGPRRPEPDRVSRGHRAPRADALSSCLRLGGGTAAAPKGYFTR